jgi:putative addiction module component (TIGR02574 family)
MTNLDFASLQSLPVGEKLHLVTRLWDDIAASSPSITLPPEVISEAMRRSAEIHADPSMAIGDEELWRRVDG